MKEWWFRDKDRVKVTIYLFVFLINLFIYLFIILVPFNYILNYTARCSEGPIARGSLVRGHDSPRARWSEGPIVRGFIGPRGR